MVFNTLSVTRWNGVFWGPVPTEETESLNHLRQTLINLADLEALDLG